MTCQLEVFSSKTDNITWVISDVSKKLSSVLVWKLDMLTEIVFIKILTS